MNAPNIPEMLWKHVAIKRHRDCWLWTGPVNSSGYGGFSCRGELKGAHVWAFKLHYGRWPDKGCALHRCDNRLCCNPTHLFDGSLVDNSVDAWAKGRNCFQNGVTRPAAEAHANAKLTNQQAREIVERYDAGGVRQIDLAAEYGVSQRVISLITRGESYIPRGKQS